MTAPPMIPTELPSPLFAALQRLLAVLVAEDTALRALDLPGIDAATTAKLELEPTLRRALAGPPPSAADASDLQRLRDEVTTRARDNHRRLRASLVAITDLVEELTGTTRATYGRTADGPVRPVLTDSVG
jgi:hypothetical protein